MARSEKDANTAISEALKRCRTTFWVIAFFSFFVNLLSLSFPIFLLQVYDRVIPNRSVDTLLILVFMVLVAVMAYSGLDTLRSAMLAKLGRWIDLSSGVSVFEANIMRAKKRGTRQSSQFFRNLAAVRDFVGGPNIIPLFDGPWTPLFIAALFLMHPMLGYISVGGIVLLVGAGLINEFLTRRTIATAEDTSSRAVDYATAATRNADVIEAMGMRRAIAERWRSLYEAASEDRTKSERWAIALQAATRFLRTALMVCLLATAAFLIVNDELTAGSVIAAMLLFRRSVAPMERAIECWKSFVSAREGYQSLNKHLRRLPDMPETPPMFDPDEGLKVDNVSVHVRGIDVPILRRIDLHLSPGEAIAITGPTAAGKTTLAQVILGNISPSRGEVLLGGIDAAIVDREVLGPLVGYLPQTVELFDGSIRDNISRMQGGELDDVVEAARLAGINKMICSMPEQYDTDIGEGGALLSGGQRQRIGLARALYGRPGLVVLDEPDANLDDSGRWALERAIRKATAAGAMVIVITHRRSGLSTFDRVFKLVDGRLHEVIAEKDADSSKADENRTLTVVSSGEEKA